MLKSDSFWFTRLFIFVAGSLWAVFGCEVACLGETSGFRRLSDSRYVLILRVCVDKGMCCQIPGMC